MTDKIYVGNKWLDSTETLKEINPHDESIVAEVFVADKEITQLALNKAVSFWKKTKEKGNLIYERIELLHQIAKNIRAKKVELSVLLSKENGRPITLTRSDVERTVSIFDNTADLGKTSLDGKLLRGDVYSAPKGNENRMIFLSGEPVGPVLAITPFNAPLVQLAFKIAPAILTGCPVIVKPSPFTSSSTLEVGKILQESGLEDDMISILPGGVAVVDQLLESYAIRVVTFTGSSAVGKEISRKSANTLKKVVLELGGADPMLVAEDANVEAAALAAAAGRFSAAGQACNTTKRIFVHQSVAKEFLEYLLTSVQKMKIGNPLDEKTEIGPVISENALNSLLSLVSQVRENGGTLLAGGDRMDGKGYYMQPTVLEDRKRFLFEKDIEVFGPILPIYEFSDYNEAINTINTSKYGLQASVFTEDIRRGIKLGRMIETGAVIINESDRLRWDAYPFGGVKDSGLGREGVLEGIKNYLNTKLYSVLMS
ncbi:MAG: aldehyde dehydrogenase family protein [Candidatus Micrarchaeaceae archaeon]